MGEKVIGILGGMGPEATLYLFEKIIKNTPAFRDQDHIRVVIDNNPKIPDRTPDILHTGESPISAMVQSGLSLERAGVDFIIIPCISAHFFLDELWKELAIPILSAVDQIAFFLERHYPHLKTLGLLATTGTIHGGLFQNRLLENEITTIVPAPDNQQRLMDVVYGPRGVKAGYGREENKGKLIRLASHLVQRGAQGIIAGCTEIPLVLKPHDLSVPFFDSLLILARSAIREAGREPVIMSTDD